MKPKARTAAPDLKPETVAILLRGWDAYPPEPPGPHGFGGGFAALCNRDDMTALWREHEVWLRDVARRWGWTPRVLGQDGRRRFYAEHIAVGGE